MSLLGGAEEVRRRYQQQYIPGQQLYLQEVQPERLASVVIDNTDPLHLVLECPPSTVRQFGKGAAEP